MYSAIEAVPEVKESAAHLDRILDLVGEEGLLIELTLRGLNKIAEAHFTPIPMEEFMFEFRERANLENSKGTRATYEVEYNKFTKFLTNAHLMNSFTDEVFTHSVIKDYLDTQSSKKQATRNKAIAAIRKMYRFAYEQRWVASAAPPEILKHKTPTKIPRALEVETVHKILDAARRSKYPVRTYMIILTLAGTGCRISEVLGMRVGHFKWSEAIETGRFTVAEATIFGKNNKDGRQIVLGRLGEILHLYIQSIYGPEAVVPNTSLEEKHIFSADNGTSSLSSTTVRETLHRLVESIPDLSSEEKVKITPHAFRHTLATTLLEQGADLQTVADLLGHKNLETTKVYTEVRQSRIREFVDKVQTSLKLEDIYGK